MSGYQFSQENFEANYAELEPLFRAHYAEMQERLAGQGVDLPDYNPRLDHYFGAARAGHFLNYVVRSGGEAVGYGGVWLTSSMHNREFMAKEDTVFIRRDHRNGVGKKFVRYVLEDLKVRGVKKLEVTALTDLRVEKLWRRMGFVPVGTVMVYRFQD